MLALLERDSTLVHVEAGVISQAVRMNNNILFGPGFTMVGTPKNQAVGGRVAVLHKSKNGA